MQNFCQILCEKIKKISVFVLIFSLIYGLPPAAEGISAKLRGKIALGVVLSGIAYTTHTLMKRDRQTVAELRHHLGVPERVVQFERGFDLWRIEHYADRHYIFRNNRLIPKQGLKVPFSDYNLRPNSLERLRWKGGSREERWEGWKECSSNLPAFQSSNLPHFLSDTPVLRYPRWSQLYLLDSLEVPQLVSFDLRRLAIGRSLDPQLWLSH